MKNFAQIFKSNFRTMRSYLERARAANPRITNERKLIEIACEAYNSNVNRSTDQKPADAINHAQEIRDFVSAQRAKNYEKNMKKYDSVPQLKLGDLVHQRIRRPFGKESSLSNVPPNVYKTIKVIQTWPLHSYKLEDVVEGIVLPGSYQANTLILKK